MVNCYLATPKNERQQSVNNFGCCILYNLRAMVPLLRIIEVLAASIGNMVNVVVATPNDEHQQSINRASTQRQQSVNGFGYCVLYNPRAMVRL
jgi:hypothetical protein